MTITLELPPNVEAVFQEQAQAHGVRMEEYLGMLMEQLAREASLSPAVGRASLEEFERALDLFSVGTEGLPALSDADLSREAMYADHD